MPRVSVGLPVFNGEDFLAHAIEGFLSQTFQNFELIISDNGSADATRDIAEHYADLDSRVRYYRHSENLGASRNYTRVFELANGEYFKWAAHDDVCQSRFLASCVRILDRQPHVVLVYTTVVTIDDQGRPVGEITWTQKSLRPALRSDVASDRFRECLIPFETYPLWGLIRTAALRQTRLLGPYPAHDLPLLAELCLHGSFYQVQEPLFLHRQHVNRASRQYDHRNHLQQAVTWYDPKLKGRLVFPWWRLLAEYLGAIRRGPISLGERLRCYRAMTTWVRRYWAYLSRDLVSVLAGRLKVADRLNAGRERRWKMYSRAVSKDLETLIPAGATFALVDNGGDLWHPALNKWSVAHFFARDGQYCGPPADDDAAVSEIESLRQRGIAYLVFSSSALWLLDYYQNFAEYLYQHFTGVLKNKRITVFSPRNP